MAKVNTRAPKYRIAPLVAQGIEEWRARLMVAEVDAEPDVVDLDENGNEVVEP